MSSPQFNLELALEARDEGIRRVAVSNEQYIKVARAIARQIASQRGSVTSDDVRQACDLEPVHPGAYGAIFKSKDFQWTGQFRQSEAVSRHGGMQRVWRLA